MRNVFTLRSLLVNLAISLLGAWLYCGHAGAKRMTAAAVLIFVVLESLIVIKLQLFAKPN